METKELKNILYTLYILNKYKESEEPENNTLNSLMIHSISSIDNNIKNKNDLMEIIKNKLKNEILNEPIEFDVGDLKRSHYSSSNIHLKFNFIKEGLNTSIDVIKNGLKVKKIDI